MHLVVVKPTGEFSLADSQTGTDIKKGRHTAVLNTPFVQQRVGKGELEVFGKLPEKATNADFQKVLTEADGDVDYAIEAYTAELEPPPADED